MEHFKGKGQIKYAKMAVASSMFFNLLLLLFFKYWDFLASSFQALGLNFIPVLGVHLPIGISFYTFQTMSYTIDVYRGDTRAQRNIITPCSPSSSPAPSSSTRIWAIRSTSGTPPLTSLAPGCRCL